MRLKYKFLIQEVAGSYMAVAVGEDAENYKDMIKMNGTAKRILELLQQGLNEDAIVEILLREFNATENDVRQSVETLLDQLRSQNLLIEEYV